MVGLRDGTFKYVELDLSLSLSFSLSPLNLNETSYHKLNISSPGQRRLVRRRDTPEHMLGEKREERYPSEEATEGGRAIRYTL